MDQLTHSTGKTVESERETRETAPGVNGIGKPHRDFAPEVPAPVAPPRLVVPPAVTVPLLPAPTPPRPVVAVFCFEAPDSPVGQYVGKIVQALARRQVDVVLFCRLPFAIDQTAVTVHAVGPKAAEQDDDLLAAVEEFTRQAARAFGQQFPAGSAPTALLGQEWATIPTLLLLHEHTGHDFHLALHSLERQRSKDLTGPVSSRIDEIEANGLQDAAGILVQDQALGETIRHWLPECGDRVRLAAQPFPTRRFSGLTDAGMVKGRYQVGPVDPTILFVGSLDEAHGPDVLMKSVPAVVKNHPQARFVFVGDGDLLWPLRVYARYLLLEGVVRLVGHLEGQPMDELMQAADVVVVPSRRPTEWWPFQAAWAARKPVVVTHAMGAAVLEHEKDAILVYAHESSIVWGIERLLYDARLRQLIGHRGHEKLEERFGWNSVAGQLESLLGIKQTA